MDDPIPVSAGLAARVAALRAVAPVVAPVPAADPDAVDVSALVAASAVASWERSVPAKFARATLEGLRSGPAAEAICSWARSDSRANLVIVGAVGVGKSHAAWAAARARAEAGWGCSGATLASILEGLRPERTPVANLAARLLVLDDVGVESRSEWVAEQVDRLFDERWTADGPVIVTSNLAPAALAERLGERAWSRLAGGAVVVSMVGPDRRFPKQSV